MGKKVVLLIFSCWLLAINCGKAQLIDSAFKYKGILSATGTFAFGTMPQNNISNAYLIGNLEYYADKKISIRGDDYLFINSLSQNSPLKKNEETYFGAFYHFLPNSQFDLLLGFQPGLSYTQMLINGNLDVATICPLASFVTGFNLFAANWFHIQVNIRYAIGEHLTQADETNISELSFNFGLGVNLNVLGKHK